MFPLDIKFTYTYKDCYQDMWDQLKESKRRIISKLIVFGLLFILTAGNILSAMDVIVSYIILIISLGFLLKYVAYLLILPSINFYKRKKWGEVHIQYKHDGINSIVRGQSNSTPWYEIDEIEQTPHSYRLVRKNHVSSQRVPIRVFDNEEQYKKFVQEVKGKIKSV